jgi:uncharacterized phage protein gp47/JayE
VSLATPTTAQISANIISQIQAKIGQTVPFLPKAFINVLAAVLAGIFILLWKYAGANWLNMFVAYASDQPTTINGQTIVPLVELGRLLGVGDPEPATQAQLAVQVTVTHMTGSLSAGQAAINSSTGVIYNVVADVLLNALTVTAIIQAVSDQSGGDGSGAIGNMQPGDIVAFANPLPNVSTNATVLSQVVTGADAEPTPLYRSKILRHRQNPPQGGAYADYQGWALSAPGIINAYPYAGPPGQVLVYCEADTVSSGSPDGIPTSPQLAGALAAINVDVAGLATRRPVNAAVTTLPITRTGFALTVTGLLPDTTPTRNAIRDGVDEYLRTREPFIDGLSAFPRTNRISNAAVSGVVQTIVESAGATVTSITLTPGPAYDLGNGEKAKLTLPPTFA